MKNFGILLIFVGIGIILYAFSMDTSVAVNYSSDVSNFPERVNNIGLMNDKQNYLIFGGLTTLIGVIVTFLSPKHIIGKKCPNCAETIKQDAKICRFCQYKFESESNV